LTGNFGGPDSLRKSYDLGQTWEVIAYSPLISSIEDLLDQNDTHLLYRVNPNGNSNEVFSYSIINDTWHPIPNTVESLSPFQSYINNNRIYTSIDNVNGLSINSCALDGSDDQNIYNFNDLLFFDGFVESNGFMGFLAVGLLTPFGGKDLYVSNDNGQTFTFQATLYNAPYFINFKPLESGEYIVNASSNVLRVSPDLQTFTPITNGFKLTNISDVTSINNFIYATKAGVIFQRSGDNGVTFENLTDTGIPQGKILQKGDSIFYETVVDLDVLWINRSFNNQFTLLNIAIVCM
jgi:hypothetical protein